MTGPMHLVSLVKGDLPEIPTGDSQFVIPLPDYLKDIAISCRNMDPPARPSAKEILSHLQKV